MKSIIYIIGKMCSINSGIRPMSTAEKNDNINKLADSGNMYEETNYDYKTSL